jgi:hypothetical protein
VDAPGRTHPRFPPALVAPAAAAIDQVLDRLATRLDRAGASDAGLFTKPALDVVAEVTGGAILICGPCTVGS